MKKIVHFFVLIIFLASCNQQANKGTVSEMEQLTKENQELKNQIGNKETEINSYLQSFNTIQENLDGIKKRQGILKQNTLSPELQRSRQEQIVDDMNIISELLGKNKEELVRLKSRLKKSGAKIEELSKLVEKLEAVIAEKDEEINLLKEELERSNTAYKELFVEYIAKTEEIEEVKSNLETTTSKLNKGYYAYGTKKELKEKGVLTKEGGFIGIGKNDVLKEDFNKEYFTSIDINQLKQIPLGVKKARLITIHPKGSYKFQTKEKRIEQIIILNAEEFWSVSKYLVILVE